VFIYIDPVATELRNLYNGDIDNDVDDDDEHGEL
jgi:hypothetical protein